MSGKFMPPFQLAGDWTGKRFANWPLLRAQLKVDGVRGWWDGEKMWTRGGKQVSLPSSWRLPSGIVMDGEIAGLDVSVVSGVVTKGGKDPRWKSLRFHVFDLPRADGDYDQRRALLEEMKLQKCCEIGEVRRVPSEGALKAFQDEVTAAKGEGLILRLGSGKYTDKASAPCVVWKMKIKQDFEGRVVRAFPAGKKVLECVTTSGARFNVSSGITKALMENPPAEGTVIVCSCGSWTGKGNPRHTSFLRIRDEEVEGKGRAPAVAATAMTGAPPMKEKSARKAAGLSGDSTHQVSKRMEMVDVEQLTPYADEFGKNPRIHDEEDLGTIRKSIMEIGWMVPVIIDEKNVVLDGNGRLMVAQEMGLKKVPCIRVSGLSQGKKRVAGLIINNIGKRGRDDKDTLIAQIAKAVQDGAMTPVSLEELGFDEDIRVPAVGASTELIRQMGESLGLDFAAENESESEDDLDDEQEGGGVYKGFKQEGNLHLVAEKISREEAASFRTPLPYHGGKGRLVPLLRPLVTKHCPDATFYLEAFAGGLALLWSFRTKFPTEIVNDRSLAVVSFWSVMKTRFDEFLDLAEERGIHSEALFKQAQQIVLGKVEAASSVEMAWGLWYSSLNAGSYDGRQNFLVGYDDNKAKKFRTRLDEMRRRTMARLEEVSVMESDAVGLIRRFGSRRNVIIYADPPYLGDNVNQGFYSGYTQPEFDDLLAALAGCHARWVLSSYENPSLDEMVAKHGWFQAKLRMHSSAANTHSGGPREKIEVITTNFAPPVSAGAPQ